MTTVLLSEFCESYSNTSLLYSTAHSDIPQQQVSRPELGIEFPSHIFVVSLSNHQAQEVKLNNINIKYSKIHVSNATHTTSYVTSI